MNVHSVRWRLSIQGPTAINAKASEHRIWYEGSIGGNYGFKNVDIAADGNRILALMPVTGTKGSQEAQHQVTFLLNFFDELRRRVPLGK